MRLTSSVPLRVDVPEETVKRVGYLLDIIHASETKLVDSLWNTDTFNLLQNTKDLPKSASVIAARFGWDPEFEQGAYVPSRVSRIVGAQTVSVLKTLSYRDRCVQAELNGGNDREFPRAFSRGVHRQMAKHFSKHGGVKPVRLPDIQPDPPAIQKRARLGAADEQFVKRRVEDGTLIVSVKLPVSPNPVCRKEWVWTEFRAAIPKHVQERDVSWCSPELTLREGDVVLRAAYEETTPDQDIQNVKTCVGVDWSPSGLGVLTVVTERGGVLYSDYRGHRFEDRGLETKSLRLQQETERLFSKARRIEGLASNAADHVAETLLVKSEQLKEEGRRCGAKRKRVHVDEAHLFAKFVVDHARMVGAEAIAFEDLSTLEAGKRGPKNNRNTSQSPRRLMLSSTTHSAARNGITVVTVPARDTSKNCPCCDHEVLRPRGYHSAVCVQDGMDVNRDTVGGVNCGKRGLLELPNSKRKRGVTHRVVRKVSHQPVLRDKKGPTPKRSTFKRVKRSLPAHLVSERDAVKLSPRSTRENTATSSAALQEQFPEVLTSTGFP